MHSQLDAFSNVLHLVHVIHSCALPYVCILNVMHISAFRCMHMRCILMHSNYMYDAFMCITVCMHSERDQLNVMHLCAFQYMQVRCILMHESWSWASPLGGLHSPWLRVWVNASECVWMRQNASASECNVRQNAPYVWRHTNAFKCNSCRMQRIVNAQ